MSKEWGGFSLRKINLEVQGGEYFVILGPTGAGKTLLLEIVAGFHRPDEGKIIVGGEDVTDLPPERRRIGFVYQEYFLFPHLKVRENVEFGLRMRGEDEKKIRRRSLRIMRALGIDHLKARYPAALSGGEKQRVALARALVLEPRLLLLDEPLSALDPITRENLRNELKSVHRRFGTTFIHVTHDREEALLLADRIGVMNKGRIVEIGEPEKIFRKPRSEFVANFVGFENVFRGTSVAKGGIAEVDLGNGVRIEAVGEKSGGVKACIRPEEIFLSKRPLESSGRNVLRGWISEISDRGATVRLKVRAGKEFAVIVTKRSFEDLKLRTGSKVYLTFKASAVHLI